MKQILRAYQEKAVQSIIDAWAEGLSPLVAMATGGGKTTVFSELLLRVCNPHKQRALVLAHTEEIICQSEKRINDQFSGQLIHFYTDRFLGGIGVVTANTKEFSSRIVVATRQSLHETALPRLTETGKIDYLIIDECHHASAESYLEIYNKLKSINPEMKVCGFTATPKRSDRKALAMIFDKIAYTWSIMDGIKEGYLTPLTALSVQTDVDLSSVKTSEGDYDKKQLAAVLDTANWIEKAVEAWNKYGGNRQTLAFFPEVVMSRAFASKMNEKGIPTAHLDAQTPKEKRRQMLADFQQGQLKVIANVAVLTEGFDAPQTSCILWARPTQSSVVLTQAIGRGLRPHPHKTDCFVIDLTARDTKILTAGSLLGKKINCHECNSSYWAGLTHCPHCGAAALKATSVRNSEDTQPSFILKSEKKLHGGELVSKAISLFDKFSAAWYRSPEDEYSCAVGFDSTLLIVPPHFDFSEYEKLSARLEAGDVYLEEKKLEEKTDNYQSALKLYHNLYIKKQVIDQYTLWLIHGDKDKRMGERVEYLDSDTDILALLSKGDSVYAQLGGKKMRDGRAAAWRLLDPSDPQKTFLEKIGKSNMARNRGEAALIITHEIARNTYKHYQDNFLSRV